MALPTNLTQRELSKFAEVDGAPAVRIVDVGGAGVDADTVQGNVAHDAADAGDPVKIGGKASTSEPAAVANADRVDAYFDATGHQHVKVDAVVPGTGATALGKAIDTAAGATDTGVAPLAVRDDALSALTPVEGDFVPLRTDANGALWTLDSNSAAIAASTSVMDDWDNAASDGASVSGDVAHDGIDAGEPVKVGHKAIAHGANPTAVAAADRTDSYANRHGVPFVIGGHMNPKNIHINVTDADGAQTDTALVTVSAGTKIVVTYVVVAADNANTGDVAFRLGFGSANTPANDATSGMVAAHPGVAKGGGLVLGNGGGILGVGGDGEDLRLTCEDPAGGSFDVTVGYYTIES